MKKQNGFIIESTISIAFLLKKFYNKNNRVLMLPLINEIKYIAYLFGKKNLNKCTGGITYKRKINSNSIFKKYIIKYYKQYKAAK